MKKLMITAGAAAFLAARSLAALALDATGSITAVDPMARTFTIDSGETFALPSDFNVATLKVGSTVTVTYEDDGKMTVTASSWRRTRERFPQGETRSPDERPAGTPAGLLRLCCAFRRGITSRRRSARARTRCRQPSLGFRLLARGADHRLEDLAALSPRW